MDEAKLDKETGGDGSTDTVHHEYGQWFEEGIGEMYIDGKRSASLMRRLYMAHKVIDGWVVAERFDDRFVTEVGERLHVATQYLGDDGDIHTNLDLRNISNLPTEIAPSVIVDYDHGGQRITEAEAAGLPEFAEVLARLRERNAEYAQFTASRDNNDLSKV